MSNVIERGTRLSMLRQCPGYGDFMLIAKAMVDKATAALVDFPGWDAQQIAVLKARAQAAKEFYDGVLASINEAIEAGYQESITSLQPPQDNDYWDSKDADDLREAMLSESRVAGTY